MSSTFLGDEKEETKPFLKPEYFKNRELSWMALFADSFLKVTIFITTLSNKSLILKLGAKKDLGLSYTR